VDRLRVNIESSAVISNEIGLQFSKDDKGHASVEFTLAYNGEVCKSGGVFNVWLDATLNFQRFIFTGLPLDIRVTFETPMFRRDGQSAAPPQRQLHRLREAAYDTHMAFLDDWFPQSATGNHALTNGAVTYQADDAHQLERLTLHLNELAQRTLMQRDMDTFRTYLQKWKHYLDDREFPGDYVGAIPE
jgi:hypothetical protein